MASSSSFMFFIFLIFFDIPTTFSLSSSYNNDNNNNNNLTFYGDSHLIINTTTNSTSVSLTNQETYSFGSAIYTYPLRFLDSKTNSPVSFFTRFSFTITPGSNPGEGLLFLITSNVGSFNQENGYMGLPELRLSSQDSFIAVEFDTKLDPFVNDINGNHVGVDVDSYASLISVDGFSSGIDFSSGERIYAWIEYRNLGKMIDVWVSYSSVRPEDPALSAKIDLSRHMKEFMHVGFVAYNGNGSALHVFDRWRFKTFESDFFPPELIPVDMTEGVDDCVICTPQVVENYEENGGLFDVKGGKKVLVIVIGVVVAVVLCLIIVVVGVLIWGCVVRRKEEELGGLMTKIESRKGVVKLSLSEIKAATGGFNKGRIIGQGGSATVYKAVFGDDQIVAVKRFNQVSRVDPLTPFTTEFATMARCLRHKNLVKLFGWCCESNELVLVYEFMPNGSLDQILYKDCGSLSVSLLTWEQRINIVLGIASCLTYLHEECDRQIIHRDVKACNVLLDADFTAKLTDFGLAEVYDRSSSSRKATIPAGTMGYLAPEYVYSGVPTVKSDVYSFGVVVLEVVSGKRAVEDDGTQIVDWAWAMWEKGKLTEAVDARLMGKYSVKDMDRMLKVGLCCVHPDSEKRPTAKRAAMMLRDEIQVPVLPAKKPNLQLRQALTVVSQRSLETAVDDVQESPWLTPKTHFGND